METLEYRVNVSTKYTDVSILNLMAFWLGYKMTLNDK